MTEQQRTVNTEVQSPIASPDGLRRVLGGLTRWWLGLFVGLIALRELFQASWWPWSLSIPFWLVFVPLVLAIAIRPANADDTAPRTLSPPVRGRWRAINSPAGKVPSHGVRSLGQAFAIDILHPSSGAAPSRIGWGLRQRPAEEFSCFGAEVHAVGDGRVVAVHGGRRDHRARTTWPGIIFMLTIEAVCREIGGPRFILGNHVVVEHADGTYAAYAHLRQGSITVLPGMTVTAAQVIGNVGNTGNTSEPHLHFQLMDRARPSRAAGLPFRWRDIAIEPESDPRWASANESHSTVDGLPGTGQVFRTTTPDPADAHGREWTGR